MKKQCAHEKRRKKKIVAESEDGRTIIRNGRLVRFWRETCAECGKAIGDKLFQDSVLK